MKPLIKLLFLILIISQACQDENNDFENQANVFSSSLDTLVITTEKSRGAGLYSSGAYPGYFRDITDSFPNPISIPENIIDVQRMQLVTDLMASTKYYVDVIKGRINQDTVFIVDENNNKNLTDDPIRPVQAFNWNSEESLIKCNYSIEKHQAKSEDFTWLRMGTNHGDDFLVGKSEHLTGDFSIDNETYQIGIISIKSSDFVYPTIMTEGLPMKISPYFALFSHNSVEGDTVRERDILETGEFIKLNGLDYRFESLSHFGDTLLLVKEKNFNNLVGTQVGMLAPEFKGVTVSGDTIDSKLLHDRTLVIANSCACGGDKKSTEAFFNIAETFGQEDIHIIRLDDGIDKSLTGLHMDMSDALNKEIYHKYRQAYCSRVCYTISKENRIVDKFKVTEWEDYLPKLLSHKS